MVINGSNESNFESDWSSDDIVTSYFSSICGSSVVGSFFNRVLPVADDDVRKPVDETPRTGSPAPRIRRPS